MTTIHKAEELGWRGWGCLILFLGPFLGIGLWAIYDATGDLLRGRGDTGEAWMQLLIGTIFALAGGGLLLMFVLAWFKEKRVNRRAAERPGEPWRWRPEWRPEGVKPSAFGSWGTGVHLFLGIIFLLFGALFLIVIPGELEKGNRFIWVALLFPLGGAWVLALCLRSLWLRFLFGSARFRMHTFPGVIGGHLIGEVGVGHSLKGADAFRLVLTCNETFWERDSDGRTQKERVLWERDAVVGRRGGIHGGETTIPVSFRIPAGLKESEEPKGEDGGITWRLTVHGRRTGLDLNVTFEIPVFRTDTSVEDPPPAPEVEAAPHSPSDARAKYRQPAWHGYPTALVVAAVGLGLFYLMNVHPWSAQETEGIVEELRDLGTGTHVSGAGVSQEVKEPGIRVRESGTDKTVDLRVPRRIQRRAEPGDPIRKPKGLSIEIDGRRYFSIGGLATSNAWLMILGLLLLCATVFWHAPMRKTNQTEEINALALVEETHERFVAAYYGQKTGLGIAGAMLCFVGFTGIFMVPWSIWSAFSNLMLTAVRLFLGFIGLIGLLAFFTRRDLLIDRVTGEGRVRNRFLGACREVRFRLGGNSEVGARHRKTGAFTVLRNCEQVLEQWQGPTAFLGRRLPEALADEFLGPAPRGSSVRVGRMRAPAHDLLVRVVQKWTRQRAGSFAD